MNPGVQVQPAAEPEEVLQAVAQAVPAALVVDQLDAALDDVGVVAPEGEVDVAEQLGVDDVLGVEDPDDLAAGVRQRGVEGAGLVLLGVGVDDRAHLVGVLGGEFVGDGGGAGVVVADDQQDLEVRVVDAQHLLDRVPQDGLFVAGRDQQ
jgi:hypothetical protein